MIKLNKNEGVEISKEQVEGWIQEGLRDFRKNENDENAQYYCYSGNTLLFMTRLGENGVRIQVCTVREDFWDWNGELI